MKRPFDGKALGEQVVGFVREFVGKHVATLRESIAALDERIKAIPAGPQGERGPAGESIKGDRGEPGSPGKDGSCVYSGEGPPGERLGKAGDHYIDTLTGDLYRCD